MSSWLILVVLSLMSGGGQDDAEQNGWPRRADGELRDYASAAHVASLPTIGGTHIPRAVKKLWYYESQMEGTACLPDSPPSARCTMSRYSAESSS
ncbi:MAG: hypothetical protein DWQ36_08955 [Acidobacteria bacterium]|nr:MAG: hypothetical protein DWQ30_22200 [Acidobacteriota bacterium]REK08490.1 MAG: hypothetical protein DWQ36_08955 [Acidobacteriota bacterium]